MSHAFSHARVSVSIATATDPGPGRSGNQDGILTETSAAAGGGPLLLAIADGMGGHEGGDVASEAALDAARLSYRSWTTGVNDWPDRIASLFTLAREHLAERASRAVRLHGMGSTLTVAVVDKQSVVFGHAGDSRLYLFRSGRLRQMTTDHTVACELVARGDITIEDAAFHVGRSILTRALTPGAPIEPEQGHTDLAAGDLLLLVTDGVHGTVTDAAMAATLASVDAGSVASLQDAVDSLLSTARKNGGTDDASAVLVGVTR